MRLYKIAVHGDNDDLHQKALIEAIKVIEEVNKTPVYRAWIETPEQIGAHAKDLINNA